MNLSEKEKSKSDKSDGSLGRRGAAQGLSRKSEKASRVGEQTQPRTLKEKPAEQCSLEKK